MKQKRTIVMIGLSFMLAVCGCGKEQTKNSTTLEWTEEETISEQTETEEFEEMNEKTTAAEEKMVIDRSETFALLKDMRIGWNLGNTLDAHGGTTSVESEMSWGNPKTTPEMMKALAAQGIKTVRIPVTWSQHMSDAPDYVIEEAWLNRVEEVVNYALDADMYVILNTHHEPDYWLKPQSEGLDEVTKELCALWKQIAERFRDYDEHLLFEGMNEPRIKGSAKEWSGGEKEERAAVNVLNQAFVDTVRSTGGANKNRCLIICPYGNSATYNSLTELTIPADNHIMVAVHLYTPYFFTYEPEENNINEWDGSLKKDIISTMQLVDRYLIQKGVPVIITEFGAVNKNYINADGIEVSNREDVLNWLADYMEVTNKYGITCVWWDNGIYDSTGEKFAIFDRKNLSWYAQDIADALIAHTAD